MEALTGFLGNFVGSFVGFFVCGCYRGAVSVNNPFVSRLWHLVLFMVFIGLAYFSTQWGQELIQHIPFLNSLCPSDVCDVLLVYRLSLAYTLFHLLLSAATMGANNSTSESAKAQANLQHGCWGIKFPLLLILVVVAGFIPEPFFLVYGWIILGLAVTFLIIQLVLIVDFSYAIVHQSAQMRYSDPTQSVQDVYADASAQVPQMDVWAPIFVLATIIMFFAAIILNVYMVFLLQELPNCHPNIVIICMNLLIIVAIVYGSLNKRVRQASSGNGGIFQASVVTLFGTFLTWCAVIVNDPGQCTEPYVHGGTIYWFTVAIGSIYALGLIFFSSMPEFGKSSHVYNYSKVNLLYALAAAYLAMLMTGWSVIQRYEDDEDSHEVETNMGWLPVVIHIFSLGILAIYYTASLIGPVCWPTHFRRNIRDVSQSIATAVHQEASPVVTEVRMPQNFIPTPRDRMMTPQNHAFHAVMASGYPSRPSSTTPAFATVPEGVAISVGGQNTGFMTTSTRGTIPPV